MTIQNVLEHKKDTCVIMPTGFGKSLCYQFPALHSNKISIVIEPLISIMNDQYIQMLDNGIQTLCMNSLTAGNLITNRQRAEIMQDIYNLKYLVIYMTPEYFMKNDVLIRELDRLQLLNSVTIDEAHCIVDFGNDIRPVYKQLVEIKEMCSCPIVTLTATATPYVLKEIRKVLRDGHQVITRKVDRDNLNISFKLKTEPVSDLVPLLQKYANERVIIYCQAIEKTKILSEMLNNQGFASETYNSTLNNDERIKIHQSFMNKKINIIVATTAYGMGVNCIIRCVIHYGAPNNLESYTQCIGRAGRDNLPAQCVLFYSIADNSHNIFLISKIQNYYYQQIRLQQYKELNKLIYTRRCRRQILDSYYERKKLNDPDIEIIKCNNCDNCLEIDKKQLELVDYTQPITLLLQIIRDIPEISQQKIIDLMRGSMNKVLIDAIPNIKQNQYHGSGKKFKYNKQTWQILIQYCLNTGIISEYFKSTGALGVNYLLTQVGKEWLESENKMPLCFRKDIQMK